MRAALFAMGLASVGLGAQLGAAAMHLGLLVLVILVLRHRPDLGERQLWMLVIGVIVTALVHAAIGLEPPNWHYATFPRYTLILPLVAALAAAASEADRRRALFWVLGLGALSSVYGASQVIFRHVGPLAGLHSPAVRRLFWVHRPPGSALTFLAGDVRATGMVHHILAFGHISALLALTGVAAALWTKRKGLRIAASIAAALCGTGVVLSGVRAGLLGLGLGLVVMAALRFGGSLRRIIVGSLCLAVLGAALVPIFAPAQVARVANLTGRKPIWEHARGRVADSFPRGLGYGSYPAYASRIYPTVPALVAKRTAWAHNTWLTLVVEAPAAALAWLALWLWLLRRAMAGFTARPLWGGIMVTSLLAWLLISMFHDSHFQRVYAPFSFWLWGLCAGGIGSTVSKNDTAVAEEATTTL